MTTITIGEKLSCPRVKRKRGKREKERGGEEVREKEIF